MRQRQRQRDREIETKTETDRQTDREHDPLAESHVRITASNVGDRRTSEQRYGAPTVPRGSGGRGKSLPAQIANSPST